MSSSSPVSSSPALTEATEWYWELQEADITPARIAEWQAWLAASDAHRDAFATIEQTLQRVDEPVAGAKWPSQAELKADEYRGLESVQVWRDRRAHRSAARTWGIAASIAFAVAIAGASFWLAREPGAAGTPTLYATALRENRTITLADGSTIDLGAQSKVRVAYSHERRDVVLDAGEAYFSVAKDARRPFAVAAGNRQIVAVGTAFNVSQHDSQVVLTVAEGTVAISVRGSASGHPIRVRDGQRLTYTATAESVTAVDRADVAAWRSGQLRYRGDPLRYVIDDVNRYAQQRIVLADPAAGDILFTGTVFPGRIPEWLDGLQEAFPLRVERTAEAVVVRSRREVH